LEGRERIFQVVARGAAVGDYLNHGTGEGYGVWCRGRDRGMDRMVGSPRGFVKRALTLSGDGRPRW
jgi:hypothetical protein